MGKFRLFPSLILQTHPLWILYVFPAMGNTLTHGHYFANGHIVFLEWCLRPISSLARKQQYGQAFLSQQSLKLRVEVHDLRSAVTSNQPVRWNERVTVTVTVTVSHTHTHTQMHSVGNCMQFNTYAHRWTNTFMILLFTCKSMHVHRIEHACLWGSCLIMVSGSLSPIYTHTCTHAHTCTYTQIIVSNLGPHICRVLQRTRPHQEYIGDLHTTVGTHR